MTDENNEATLSWVPARHTVLSSINRRAFSCDPMPTVPTEATSEA
jgi:hypothetical protein